MQHPRLGQRTDGSILITAPQALLELSCLQFAKVVMFILILRLFPAGLSWSCLAIGVGLVC